MTRRAVACLFLGLLLCFLNVLAADKPNFSGSWKLNVDKSEFGPMPKPDKADYVVAHKDPEMNVKSTVVSQMGEMTNEEKILTDGTEFTNNFRGQEVKGTAKWDGQTLIVTRKLDMQGATITIVGKWTLSEDGKTITQDLKISTPQGELAQKLILEKI